MKCLPSNTVPLHGLPSHFYHTMPTTQGDSVAYNRDLELGASASISGSGRSETPRSWSSSNSDVQAQQSNEKLRKQPRAVSGIGLPSTTPINKISGGVDAEDEIHPEKQARKESDDDEPLYEDEGESKFWKETIKLAEKRDRVMIKGWNDCMDVLLIFAGLFSAVVTAFLIESYKRLGEDSASVTNALIRWQIGTSQGIPQSFNPLQPPTFEPSSNIVRVNCLWFSSLIISLGATVVTVLAKQWIDDYDDYKSYPGSSRDRGKIRQSRYTNLQHWRVATIIDSLPTLLLTALGLFFVGLVDFLWVINVTVARTALAFIAVIAAFFAFTTVSPMFSPRCAYKTPLSTLFLILGILLRLYGRMSVLALYLKSRIFSPWKEDGHHVTQYLVGVAAMRRARSDFHLFSGWRNVIRQAEQQYIKATGTDTTAHAIAWLVESSTDENHTHAAIRATAGLEGTKEQLKLLESAGMKPAIVERHVTAFCRREAPSKITGKDGMLVAAGISYLHWRQDEDRQRRKNFRGEEGKIRTILKTLLSHTDKNLSCYACCALLRVPRRLRAQEEILLWDAIIELLAKHSRYLRVKALERITGTVRLHLAEPGIEYAFTLYQTAMTLLDSSARAWKCDEDDIFRLTTRDRLIIRMPSLSHAVDPWLGIRAKWRPDAAASTDISMALYAFLILLQSNKGISPSEERFIAVAEAVPKIFAPASARARQSLMDVCDDQNFLKYSKLVRELLCQKLSATKNSKEARDTMWAPILKAYLALEPYSTRDPLPLEDLDIPSANCLMNTSIKNLLHPLLSFMMDRGAFWDRIKELILEASMQQLQNLAISVIFWPRGDEFQKFRPRAMVEHGILSAIADRLDAIYTNPNPTFSDDHFILVSHLADVTGCVCRFDLHLEAALKSGIVNSLERAWDAMEGSRGDAWLKDRINFWGGKGSAPWEGFLERTRLRSLGRRAERRERYLTSPNVLDY